MQKDIRFVGLDVHKETIAIGVAEPSGGEVRSLGTIPNEIEAIGKLVKKLRAGGAFTCCYEAGPTGYVLYWQMVKLGVSCVVIAPSLVPTKAGDRVKTDRRDAERLARCYRAGDLTPVWVPTPEHEALRDLVRAREAAKKDERRARHRLQKFLLRRGIRTPQGMREWAETHRRWVLSLTFELAAQQATLLDYAAEVDHVKRRIERLEKAIDEAIAAAPPTMRAVIGALQAMRGISKLTATTIVSEVGELSRFDHPRELMSYSGSVPSEHSSGGKTSRSSITKTGNAHLRRVIGEAAWHYRHRPRVIGALRKRQQGVSSHAIDIAWKAQERLHRRYRQLSVRKCKQKVVTAIGREMLGFIWDIGVEVERSVQTKAAS
jgi:transposase